MQLQQRTIMQLILYRRQKRKFNLSFVFTPTLYTSPPLFDPNSDFTQIKVFPSFSFNPNSNFNSTHFYPLLYSPLCLFSSVYIPPELAFLRKSKIILNYFSRSQLVAQPQHAMSIMKSLMHGPNMVHTILAKIIEIINHSNSVMFSRSKYQQNIGPEMDSQFCFDGEIFKVHLSNFGMPIFSISTERMVEWMY